MKHQTTVRLLEIAEVKPAPQVLTRRERLERWAALLDRDPAARLRTLDAIEWHPKAGRASMRADGSPLTVAYNDPVLRAAGLNSDTLGDAMRFFELSEHQAHRVVCSCMHGRMIEGQTAAATIRAISAGLAGSLSLMALWTIAVLPIGYFLSCVLMKIA
jgi:hypothetical protein